MVAFDLFEESFQINCQMDGKTDGSTNKFSISLSGIAIQYN